MAQSFVELLRILPDLEPVDIETRIRSIMRPPGGQPPDLSALAREIDAALDKAQLTSYYYGFALRASQSLTWALECFYSRLEPAVLDAAVDVLAFHLRQHTDATLARIGGVDKHLAFVDQHLSWASAKRLFKELSCRTPPPALVAANDALLAAAFTSSGSVSSPPLNRLAPVLVQTLLTACSASMVRRVLPRVPQLVSLSAWGKLVQRHPDLISELVFIQLGEEPSKNEWDNSGVLQQPVSLKPCIELLLKSGTPAGPAFFRKFVFAYAARLEKQRPSSAQQDILGVNSRRVPELDQYIKYYLETYSDRAARAAEALSLTGAFVTLSKAEGNVGWELRDIQGILLVIVKDFSRRPDLWESTLERPDSPSDEIIATLLQLFKESLPGQITIQRIADTCQLTKRPRGARFPIVAVAYAAVGICLVVQPDASAVDKFPSCPVECLGTFQPSHCRRFFTIGLEVKGDSFLITRTVSRPYGPSYSYLRGVADGLNSFMGTELQQAATASVRAAWLGAQRGTLNEKSVTQGLAELTSDVSHFVNLAAKSSVAEKRLPYILRALRLCMLAQSPTQFLANFQAAALKYAKDPVVGPNLLTSLTYGNFIDFLTRPAGLYITKSSAPSQRFLMEALRSWTRASSEILLAILAMIKSMIFNPDSAAGSSYTELGRSIGRILHGRIKLLRVLHPVLTPGEHDVVSILLQPLHDVILAWDRLKVLEQPDAMGFGWRDCIPTMISTDAVVLEPKFAQVVLAYLCELGDARMKLYRQGRNRLPLPTYDGEPPTYDTGELYDFLPLNLVISRSGSKPGRRSGLDRFYSGVAAPALLEAYCQKVLFLPLTTKEALKRAMASMDPWHFHYTQFDRALTEYLYYSSDAAEVVGKIERLLEHYSNDKNDYIFLVARHETVRIMVWVSPTLRKYVEGWLPASLWSLGQADPDKPLLIDPSRSFPKKPFARRDEEPTLLEARNRTIEQSELLGSTLAPFFHRASGYFAKLRLSITFTRRLAALAASWLLTSGGIPASDETSPPQDVVRIALAKVRLDAPFMSIHPNNQRFLAALVRATMECMRDVDVATMIGGLLSRPDNAVAQQLAFTCIRLARVARPHLIKERGSAIVGNPDLSSWHRQALCVSLLAAMKQGDALDFARTLINFISQQLAEDRKRTKDLDPAALKEYKPSIKVTTVKMIVDVLGEALSIGVLSSTHFDLLESIQKTLPHSSVKVQVVQALGQLALRDYLFAPGRPSPGLHALVAQVKTGVQLSEGYDVTDADWQSMARGTKSNIKVEAEHPVATTLLRAPVESFPTALARAYCIEVIAPCLLGQISNRTKWLQAAVAREGATFLDIQATYDDEFNAAALFTHCCQFLSYPSFSANSGPSSILDLVQRRATLFLHREPYQELLRLVKLHQPDDWLTSDYGKTVASLCSHATSDESSSFSAAIRALSRALLAGDLPREAIGLASGALTRIGEELLKPENVAACFLPSPARSREPFAPFATFLAFLSHAPAADRGMWNDRVRPILQHLTKVAETHAGSFEFQGTTRNRGALYDIRILQLKLLLLPHPAYTPFAQAVDRHRKWTDTLIQLVSLALSQPSYHRLFPGYFFSFLSKSNRMTGDDALALAELLLSNSNSTMHISCIELALFLVQTYKQEIEDSTSGRSRLEVIRQELMASEDEIVRTLAFGI